MVPHQPSRRAVLKYGAATAGLGALMPPATSIAASRSVSSAITRRHENRPRNIIFMVSDGMSAGVPTLAEPFSQAQRGCGTHWHAVARSPRTTHGCFDTAALDSLVTDSAAASSAWASGSRVFNGSINTLPDGTQLTPIGSLARESGRKLGLVTTTTITHATPAGFAASVGRRSNEADIALQYLNQVDVLLGGGLEFFSPDSRRDQIDLLQTYREAGYAILQHSRDLQAAAANNKILGLFNRSHLPYTIDHQNDAELRARIPTLAEMTRTALVSLANHPHGFLLQIEGGRVDHAAHANDAPGTLWDQLAFDDAIGVARDFQREHPETLIVITTDHGNANPGLNGMGSRYRNSSECFARLGAATRSHEALLGTLQRRQRAGNAAPAWIAATVQEATGVEITIDEAALLADVLEGRPVQEVNRQHANFVGMLGQILGNHTGIGWTGITHTADLVMLMATGPGSDMFQGLLQNTDAFSRLCDAMNVNHRNPVMDAEQAARFTTRTSPELAFHIGA